NRSVLSCPSCENPLVNIGSKVERIHPVARFIRDRYMTIVFGWVLLVPFIIGYVSKLHFGGGGNTHGMGFFALLVLPFVVNFFLLRIFPVYRITDCPYCGFHEKQHLGLSDSGEL
ncbi:hypothetical protein N9961_00615, partial [bacterium]|nr:hypothetical protein [bacterium]